MGKRITYVATRANPATNWYHQTAESTTNASWNQRLFFMVQNQEVSTEVTETETTLTSVVTFTDDSKFAEFTELTEEIQSDLIAYCNANGITYSVVTEDI